MDVIDKMSDNFDDSFIYYMIRIWQFLTDEELDRINNLDKESFLEWAENVKENYKSISKIATYEFEHYMGGTRLLIFLDKSYNKYHISKKECAPFCLEQILDKDNQIIIETIKENPYYKK